MYRVEQKPSERWGSIAVVVLLHVGVAALALSFGGIEVPRLTEDALETFDVDIPPPPEPPPPPVVEIEEPEEATPEEEGEAAPEQVRSQATPVVRPENTPPIPVPPTITSATEAGDGSDSTQGAGEVDDGGTGAGGVGNGTGSGRSGDGTGGGGQGTRPSVIPRTTLTQGDYPRAMRDRWPRGGAVLVAVRVQTDGRATDCKVNRGFGDPEIDAMTCRLVEQRVRFEPARDAQGRPYVDWYGYMQRWVGR